MHAGTGSVAAPSPGSGGGRAAPDGGATRYYADKLDSLRDLFGQEVRLEHDWVAVGPRRYPVLDDVIVLLEPDQYPAAVRERLREAGSRPADDPAVFARDIQATFGAEWTRYPAILPEHGKEFAAYFDLVDLDGLAGARVCDLGCGIGRWSHFLRDRVRELVLVDFSEAIFVARRNLSDAPNALFFMGDIKRLPFRADFADFIYCLGVLHHLPTPALAEVAALGRYAPRLLIYLYYALDNRPAHYRLLLRIATALRVRLARVERRAPRDVLTWTLTLGVYLPLITLGRVLRPLGLARHVPLYEGYHDKGLARIRQDVYDRFFTRIEQRVARKQIRALEQSFSQVRISDGLPFWHFVCEREAAPSRPRPPAAAGPQRS